MRTSGKVPGESSNFFGAEIDEQTLRENQDSVCAPIETGKQCAPGAAVRQVCADAFQRARRFLVRKNPFLVSKNFRQIDFDPLQRSRQTHTIRPRVQAAARFTTMSVPCSISLVMN